jgi:TP901 family phage tail tape measure protein
MADFSATLTAVGVRMLSAVTVASTPFALATRVFSGFDDELRKVQAVTGATNTEFQKLTRTAEKLGRETSFTAKQVAEGMTAMGRMGFSSQEIDHAIGSVLNLSRATSTDLGDAAEIAANNMRVFGIAAGDMADVADILTATANGSAQTLINLAEGLKMAGPQAAAAKDNIINVAGSLGVLANMGIKGSLAGTALRKAYSQFANTKIQSKLNGIGVATADVNGNLRAMPAIMADIAQYMNRLPTAKRLSFAEEIFNLRGSLAGLQLGGNMEMLDDFLSKLNGSGKIAIDQQDLVNLRANLVKAGVDLEQFLDSDATKIDELIQKLQGQGIDTQWLEDFRKRLGGINGVAARTAKLMDAGIGGAFRILLSAIEGVAVTLGRTVSEAITPYVTRLQGVLGSIARCIEMNKNLVRSILKTIAGIAAAGAVLLSLGVAFKLTSITIGTASAAFIAMKAAVLAPLVPLGLLRGAYRGLIATFATVKTASIAMATVIASPWGIATAAITSVVAIGAKLFGIWDGCSAKLRTLGGLFISTFRGMGELFAQTWSGIKTAFVAGDLVAVAKVALGALNVVWQAGLVPLKESWLSFKRFLANLWVVAVYDILKTGNNLWNGLLIGFKQCGNGIMGTWDFLVARLLKAANNCWYGILIGLKTIGNAMQNAWNYIWDGILDRFGKTVLELQKTWIRTKGMFASKEKVSAEIDVVQNEYNRQTSERNTKRRQGNADYQAERDALTEKRRQINKNIDDEFTAKSRQRQREQMDRKSDWGQRNAVIDGAQVREILGNTKSYNDAVARAAAGIEKAKRDWQDAMDEIKVHREEKQEETAIRQSQLSEASRATSVAGIAMEDAGMRAVRKQNVDEYSKIGLYNFNNNMNERRDVLLEQIAANLGVIKQCTLDEGKYAI